MDTESKLTEEKALAEEKAFGRQYIEERYGSLDAYHRWLERNPHWYSDDE